jgi:ribosome-associated protein
VTVKKAAKKKADGKSVNGVDGADSVVDGVNGINDGKSVKGKGGVLAGKELVDAIVSVLEEKLAEKISVLDLRKVSAAADWFIVCSGDNTSHTAAVANWVIGALKERHGTAPWHYEGIEDGRWALIDYTDVVAHVMLKEVREYYDLESLWG